MKRKELEGRLGSLTSFAKPKVVLEQYQTSADVAATVLHAIHMNHPEDIEDCLVADLGCGCGTLAIGASLLGASCCVGFDIDPEAIGVSSENIDYMETANVDLVICDITSWEDGNTVPLRPLFDTVIMNPPFGTKNNEGVDIKFLKAAASLGCQSIYSMHKTSTRQHILKKSRELGYSASVMAELRFDLPATMRFHKKSSVDVEVDLIRLSRTNKE